MIFKNEKNKENKKSGGKIFRIICIIRISLVLLNKSYTSIKKEEIED